MKKIQYRQCIPLPNMPIVLVGTMLKEKPNYIPVGFISGVNAKPPIVCIGINRRNITCETILQNKFFSLNFPSSEQVVKVDYCGIVSGNEVDKSTVFSTFYGSTQNVPMIEECPITCVCQLTADKVEFETDVVYFGEVKEVYVDEETIKENNRIDVGKCNPISFSAIELHYRTIGTDIGAGWEIGKKYKSENK